MRDGASDLRRRVLRSYTWDALTDKVERAYHRLYAEKRLRERFGTGVSDRSRALSNAR